MTVFVKTIFRLASVAVIAVSALGLSANGQAKRPAGKVVSQTGTVVVKQVNAAGLTSLIKPNGKPLLINFWATWCDPCREEFPDLVKIDAEYKDKIDFITVTLDDPADIRTSVPKFLAEMKAQMPAYLLKTPDESAVITMIAKDWSGGLPFTVLYDEKGTMSYFRQGKVQPDVLRTELNKLLTTITAEKVL
jgi:thiol-disulfide isomerase/thioredoxin